MEEGANSIGASAAGPSMPELVERELEALRAVDGVTSATAYERQQRQPLNKSMVKVRLQGRKDPLTVHCSGSLPNLLRAALAVAEKVAAILGSDAVAEGRLRAEIAAHAQPAAAEEPSANVFEHMQRVRRLEAELARAEASVRAADGEVRAALLRVEAEQRAVALAQEGLAAARAAAEPANEALLVAQAAAQSIRASIDLLRSKRQRVAGPETSAGDAPAGPERPPQAPHFEKFKDYSHVTFVREEVKEMWQRSKVPQQLEPDEEPGKPRMGAVGALEHWRRGLIGAVQSWAAGSLSNVIFLVMKIIDYFKVWEDVYILLQERDAGAASC